jgi:predicted naringenin-chalcone synthase
MCQGNNKPYSNYNDDGRNRPKKASSSAYVYSTAAAYGNHYTTDQVLSALLHQQRHNPSFDAEFATRVLQKCGYQKHSFALPLEDIFRRFTREEYLQLRRTHLVGLAERACVSALDRWGGDKQDITHLMWGTMTGAMDSPTIDIQLAKVC